MDINDHADAKNDVVDNAIERISWGKSRNELMCRFHNDGGLHRFSGDAPFETRLLSHVGTDVDRSLHINDLVDAKNDVVDNAVERISWGKSRNELMCRFHNVGGLHRFSGDAPFETPLLSHVDTIVDPSLHIKDLIDAKKEGLDNAVERISWGKSDIAGATNSVVDNAVERISWGKSRDELMCRFQNYGGLHRFSGDAPFETRVQTHLGVIVKPPRYCHTYKALTPSSRRTRDAAIAYKMDRCKAMKRNTKHKQDRNTCKKFLKQKKRLKCVKVPSCLALSKLTFLTIEQITKQVVICDGGNANCDAISAMGEDIYCLSIRNGDLWVADTSNASLGLRHISKGNTFPTFIRLPRKESLQLMCNGRELCNAMKQCALSQQQSLTRGVKRHVFSNSKSKYCCIGVQPGRNARGLLSGLYKIKRQFESKDWDTLQKSLCRAEHAFDKYLNTDVIRHITCAKSHVNYNTMTPSTDSSVKAKSARYYSGLGFGLNVHLRAHTDMDFTMSIVQAHIDGIDYTDNDAVICYFAFPRIGIAVALRPGDYLLFNPQEPHCISSRCKNDDEIYSMSSYLKTAVVGLNDNSNSIV